MTIPLWSALLLAAGFGVLAMRQMPLALALLLALLPTYELRFSVGPVPSTLLEVLFLMLAAIWLIRRGGIRGLAIPWGWLLLLFLLTATVALLMSPNLRGALGQYRAVILEPLLLFLLVADVIRTRAHLRLLLWGLGSGVLLIGYVAFVQTLGLFPSPEPWISESPPRVASVFAYPNAVGLFVAPLVALFAGLLLVPTSGRVLLLRRRFLLGVGVAGLLAIALSMTRGALVGLLAGFLVVLWYSPRRFRWTVLLALAFLLIVAVPSTRSQLAAVLQGADVSSDVRGVLWVGTARLLHAHPITGAGMAGFPILYDQYRLAQHTELLRYPHTMLFNVWVELGLAGVGIFILLLVRAYQTAARGVRQDQTGLSVGLLAAFTTLLVHGLVDVPYFKNDLAMLFWLLLATTVVHRRLASTE
ncbi:MAG: O-antigen ligase family protein [Candidatus Kerfeldbacteria bacterium]|nr:O-antigen ligase family protein [Candidatus Kerfeldbacteria bacterium]